MNLVACGTLLSTRIGCTVIASPEKTPLAIAAGTVLGMARAYSVDGGTFCAAGDYVNALAAYWYGFGWLHFGSAYGLFATPSVGMNCCPFQGSCERLPSTFTPKLIEKTARYAHLLDTARASIVPAPDPATSAHDFSCRILVIVGCYALQGRQFQKAGVFEDALTCFSYGHGWLDAAVRSGLFRITRERSLFTV
jgi:uncharacterized protein